MSPKSRCPRDTSESLQARSRSPHSLESSGRKLPFAAGFLRFLGKEGEREPGWEGGKGHVLECQYGHSKLTFPCSAPAGPSVRTCGRRGRVSVLSSAAPGLRSVLPI